MPHITPEIRILLAWFLLCMVIAIPCLLCGESETLHIKSHSMRKYIGVVVNNHIFEADDDSYRHFNGFCYYKYDNDKICKIKEYRQKKYRRHSNADNDDGITEPAAIVEIDTRCPINSTRTVYYDIRNGECNIVNSYEDIANVGITFMVFGAIILIMIIWIFVEEFMLNRQLAQMIQYNQITPSTESNNTSHPLPKILFENITIKKAQKCTICLETNNIDWIKTVCGHEFHKTCIVNSSKYRMSCPECRQNMFDCKTNNLKVTQPTYQQSENTHDENATVVEV